METVANRVEMVAVYGEAFPGSVETFADGADIVDISAEIVAGLLLRWTLEDTGTDLSNAL
jgi:hypothetical protein